MKLLGNCTALEEFRGLCIASRPGYNVRVHFFVRAESAPHRLSVSRPSPTEESTNWSDLRQGLLVLSLTLPHDQLLAI